MQQFIKKRSEDFAAAMRRRFRTAPTRSQMSMGAVGIEDENDTSTKQLAEDDPYGDNVPEFDPNSPEPRYLQLAKAELKRRKDLRCKDCGYMGLPPPDGLCPDCGGVMEEPHPETQGQQTMSTSDIRKAIRAQWAQKQQGQ